MGLGKVERILILAKTYPSPSAQYVETSCVAGIAQNGSMRRLFPVPFRMIEDGQQFKKWQWIDVRVDKATKDRRPESHKVYVDTINCGEVIDTKKAWAARWEWLDKMPAFDSFDAIDAARLTDGGRSRCCVRNGCSALISPRPGTRTGRMRSGRSCYKSRCRAISFQRQKSASR